MFERRKLYGVLTSAVVVGTLFVAGATSVAAAGNGQCSGGTIAPGTYGNLVITGFCTLDGGNVTVQRNLHVTSTGAMEGLFASSRLTVGGNVIVDSGGLFALGCDPVELPCLDNPDATTSDVVGRSIISDHPALMIVHDNHVGGNVVQGGGGLGLACNPLLPDGTPDYVDYALNTIGGSATVTGLRTCWAGFSHNVVGGNVNYHDNQTGIPDGNLADGNRIGGNFNCTANNPAPHLSDGPVQTLNVVGGAVRGQCIAISS